MDNASPAARPPDRNRIRDTAGQDQVRATPANPTRRRWLVGGIAGVALLSLVAWVGSGWLGGGRSYDASRLRIATVSRGDLVRDLSADGRVIAANSPTLYAIAAGTVTLQVVAGDKVAKGQPLAVVEAKRSLKDPDVGQQQARLYADCLEAMKGQRPLIFYSNGHHTWLWDDRRAPPREVQGFYSRDELELVVLHPHGGAGVALGGGRHPAHGVGRGGRARGGRVGRRGGAGGEPVFPAGMAFANRLRRPGGWDEGARSWSVRRSAPRWAPASPGRPS